MDERMQVTMSGLSSWTPVTTLEHPIAGRGRGMSGLSLVASRHFERRSARRDRLETRSSRANYVRFIGTKQTAEEGKTAVASNLGLSPGTSKFGPEGLSMSRVTWSHIRPSGWLFSRSSQPAKYNITTQFRREASKPTRPGFVRRPGRPLASSRSDFRDDIEESIVCDAKIAHNRFYRTSPQCHRWELNLRLSAWMNRPLREGHSSASLVAIGATERKLICMSKFVDSIKKPCGGFE